jgi:hypothetical protein
MSSARTASSTSCSGWPHHEISPASPYPPICFCNTTLRRLSSVTRSITTRVGVAEMVEVVPVVEREALGRGAVVVEAEARVAQPEIREGSLGQYRYRSCLPWVNLLTFVRTTLSVPLDLYTR